MGKLFRISIVLFVIGISAAVIFTYLSDSKVLAIIDEEDFTFHEQIYDGNDFSKVDLSFMNRDFVIRSSDNDQIKIEYYTTDADMVEISESDRYLNITSDIKWYNQLFTGLNFFISNEFYMVNVYLPEAFNYDLKILTSNGKINMADMDQLDHLEVDTSNGTIDLVGINAKQIDLKTSNGTVSISELNNVDILEIYTSNGRINLGNIDANKIDAKTSNGKIIANNISAEDIDLDTSNGRIELSVLGQKDDYEVYMDTSNGDLLYDGIKVSQEHFNVNGVWQIHLDTSNGDIELTFIDE